MNKDSFVLYNSFYEPLKSMTDEQLGRLLRVIFEYKIGKARPTQSESGLNASAANIEIDADIAMAFKFIKCRLDTDEKKYFDVVEKRRQAGVCGSKARRMQAAGRPDVLQPTNGSDEACEAYIGESLQPANGSGGAYMAYVGESLQPTNGSNEACEAFGTENVQEAFAMAGSQDKKIISDSASFGEKQAARSAESLPPVHRGKKVRENKAPTASSVRGGKGVESGKCKQKKQMPPNQADYVNVNVNVNEGKENINLSVYTKEKSRIDPSFIGEKFKEPFMRWLNYKKARKELYVNEDSLLTCYAKLMRESAGDPLVADAMIENAIGNNYRGFFPLKNYSGGLYKKSAVLNKSADVTAYNLKWFADKYGEEVVNVG